MKDLAKQVDDTLSVEMTEANAASKKPLTTPQFSGPFTRRMPVSMRHVQDWMAELEILGGNTGTCTKNRDPPFTRETVPTLMVLFNTALALCLKGNPGEMEADTQ